MKFNVWKPLILLLGSIVALIITGYFFNKHAVSYLKHKSVTWKETEGLITEVVPDMKHEVNRRVPIQDRKRISIHFQYHINGEKFKGVKGYEKGSYDIVSMHSKYKKSDTIPLLYYDHHFIENWRQLYLRDYPPYKLWKVIMSVLALLISVALIVIFSLLYKKSESSRYWKRHLLITLACVWVCTLGFHVEHRYETISSHNNHPYGYYPGLVELDVKFTRKRESIGIPFLLRTKYTKREAQMSLSYLPKDEPLEEITVKYIDLFVNGELDQRIAENLVMKPGETRGAGKQWEHSLSKVDKHHKNFSYKMVFTAFYKDGSSKEFTREEKFLHKHDFKIRTNWRDVIDGIGASFSEA